MNNTLKKFLAGTAMAAMLILPSVVKADGISLNVNLGADDAAHFQLKARGHRHNPLILKAAKQLINAKHTLWAAADDYHGHKVAAIQAINAALDELKAAEEVH